MSLVNVTTGMTVFRLALLSDMHRYFLGEYHDRGGCVRDVLFAILWCGLLFSYSHYCFFVCFIFVSVMKVGCVCGGGGGVSTCFLPNLCVNDSYEYKKRTVDSENTSQFRSCVRVEVDVLGCPS